MVKNFQIELEGIDNLMKALKELPKEKLQAVEDEFEAAAFDIVTDMKQRVPKDQGAIANSITFKQVGQMTFEITAQKEHAPYLEFGTKSRVSVPAELQAVALQYKGGNGKGGSLFKAITAWAKRKGIDPKLWWPIYASIKRNGTKPHPFFFPAFFAGRIKLIKNLTEIITK